MLGDTMTEIIEAILSMIISFGFIGFCVWVTVIVENWRENP